MATMTKAKYILCVWRKRWWPAKVLSAGRTSKRRPDPKSKPRTLRVEILCLNKQAVVRHADVKPLQEEDIISIASRLGGQPDASRGQSKKKNREAIDELIYRHALRQALDILSGHSISPKERKGKASPRKDTPAGASLERPAKCRQLQSPRDSHEGDSRESTAECCLGSKASPISKPQHLPAGQHCSFSEAAATVTPQKQQEPLPKSDASRRQLRSFKERDEGRCQSQGKSGKGNCFPSPNRTSTPAAASQKHRPRFAKSGVEPRVRKKLLGSPTGCVSADPARGEEGGTPPRRYGRGPNGSRRPKGTRQKRTRARNRGRSRPGDSNSADESLSGGKAGQRQDAAINVKQFQLQDFEDEEGFAPASSLRLSPIGRYSHSPASRDDEDEELPSILLRPEPCTIKAGMLVWCKMARQPFWPAVVKRVQQKARKANVILIQDTLGMNSKGFSTSFRNLKHYECKEKGKLIARAKETHPQDIDWCITLITDYLVRVGCESFTGSFLEYYAHEMSYCVRTGILHEPPQETFPETEEAAPELADPEEADPEEADPGELPSEPSPTKPPKKVLPDRARAARDKANERIVEFIVKSKGADDHLRSILRSKKPSRWLNDFFVDRPYLPCMEVYLEDDHQLELVLDYLRGVYQEADPKVLPKVSMDSIKFILDVLFPEAIIYAISAVDHIDYKKAEEIYLRGPLVSQREKEIFEEEILEAKRRKNLQSKRPPPEASL
ncbi:PWWP domain-containing DNA repair factor 3A isoform X1 [Zootoca vivipara]|uniref:PWWP domain-containing DNA repair factor 3A isoform X1 n=1 Tax=Zootoca vivipara TaxID=8524 RepID=UPI00293B8F5F|nr:PWWP domain-containing DNA repair factor 3A isoform X1 [Zootoca vivipara]XP_034976484.2 PWWP domain-containing DNA repair factor 3A isoform X1 [Zootoca vivipara]